MAFAATREGDVSESGMRAALDDVTLLAIHAPGNVAWRALGRLIDSSPSVTSGGHWKAAATLAGGLRSMFNRVEANLLIRQLLPHVVYWRAVLHYIADGGLQAVLDEYVHHLREVMTGEPLTDDTLLEIAAAASDTFSVRPSTYGAFDPVHPTPTFACRVGSRCATASSAPIATAHGRPEVRNAFNSPFWPFIVTTTSAGQEGIDFHWWCSAVVHWNTPANPVDFEQREGRVHRFGGHAIRRNVAAAHRAEGLLADTEDVWTAMYAAARAASDQYGDFAPYWVYPGDAKIERYVMPYPLSRDITRLERLKQDLALYRMAFGQPRQEDMLELLRLRGVDTGDQPVTALDLRPPARHEGPV